MVDGDKSPERFDHLNTMGRCVYLIAHQPIFFRKRQPPAIIDAGGSTLSSGIAQPVFQIAGLSDLLIMVQIVPFLSDLALFF